MNISAWSVGSDEMSTLRRTTTPIDAQGHAQIYVGGSYSNFAVYVNPDDARKIAAAWLNLAEALDAEFATVTA